MPVWLATPDNADDIKYITKPVGATHRFGNGQ